MAQGGSIDGPYRLDMGDVEEDANVCYELADGNCVERIPQTVFAVGASRDYVVAARHPHAFGSVPLDRSRTEYFYLVRALDGPLKDPSASVRGPFDRLSFERERRRLGLPSFSREITSLR
jgi:hypothetical protein